MGKGSKENKPWSFGLLGGKPGRKSIFVFVVFLVLAIGTRIGGAIYDDVQDRRSRPVLALNSVLRDVREFVRAEKQMPAHFRDIEQKIWHKRTPGAPSLLHGDNILVADNYEYIFHSGKIKGVNLVNIWAIPLGKYRDEYETMMLVVTDAGEELWRGPALSEAQRSTVLSEKSYPASFPLLSELNMKRDGSAQPPRQRQKLFGIF
jgi:hypothetical protein